MAGFAIGVVSSIVASLILALVLSLRARMPFRTLRLMTTVTPRLSRTGVTNFFASRAEYSQYRKQTTVTEYMATAREELTYVGFWLAPAVEFEDLHHHLRKLLDRRVRVTLVLLDAGIDEDQRTKIGAALGISADALRDRLDNAWSELSRFKGALPAEARARLTLASHQEHLTASAFVFDRDRPFAKTLMDVKLYGIGRQSSFGIELRPPRRDVDGSLYENATRSFGAVAERANEQQ